MDKELKRMIRVFVSICILFIGLIVYLTYFQVFTASSIKNNSYNKRLWIDEENIKRGMILDRNGKILAYSEKEGDSMKRHYNYGRLYSHVIGYSFREYGKAGLESSYNNELLNLSENAQLNEIKKIVKPNSEGNTLKLTIDHGLQQYASDLLEGKKGAIVLMNPQTGEIYAMVSKPDFNTNKLKEDWKSIVEDPDSPFLNRATMGLYAPGSTFKVVTSVAALESSNIDYTIDCEGSVNINGYTLKDYNGKPHGKLNLEEALVKSCNVYFSQLGLQVGKDKLGEVSEKFMINKKIPFDLPTKKSTFPFNSVMEKTEIAASSIGQGKILVTPLNMAMIASAIANRGVMVEPVLVKEVISPEGEIVKSNDTKELSRATDTFTANEVKNMMVEVVQRGTGKNARINNVRVAGKTGTAENPTGKAHSWFIGFVPAEDPKLAISVVLESEGSTGGVGAAPIAKQLMAEAINKIH
jgi:peptidoglycan glycosyltransferase